MRKSVTKIVKAVLGFTMAIGAFVGAAMSGSKASPVFAADVVDSTLTFVSSDSTKVSSYTTNFNQNDSNSISWKISNFNNNNWGWTSSVSGASKVIKCGRKDNASVGTIVNNSSLGGKKYTKVDLYISAATVSKINSITLYGGNSASPSQSLASKTSSFSTSTTVPTTLTISSPTSCNYYKLAFDMASGSSNGLLSLDKVVFWEQGAAKTLSSISVTTAPTKTKYIPSEAFDSNGMVVTATYTDSSTEAVDLADCELSPATITESGNVTITYNTKTTTQAVTVYSITNVTGVADGYPAQVDLNSTYLTKDDVLLNVACSDDEVIRTIHPTSISYDFSSLGTKTVTCTYSYASGTKTATFDVEVVDQGDGTEAKPYTVSKAYRIASALDVGAFHGSAVYITGIVSSTIEEIDINQTYHSGYFYITDGFETLYAYNVNKSTKTNEDGFIQIDQYYSVVIHADLKNQAGVFEIAYNNSKDKICEMVSSTAPSLLSIEASVVSKTRYAGEKLTAADFIVTGAYNNGKPSEVIPSGYTWTIGDGSSDSLVEGDNQVVVSYLGKNSSTLNIVGTQAAAKDIVPTLLTNSSLTYHYSVDNHQTSDLLNRVFTTVPEGTDYVAWSEKTGSSGVVYAGNTAANYGTIQLNNNSSNKGIITTSSTGKVLSVNVSWNSNTSNGRVVDIYGKNTAYENVTDLYDTGEGGKAGTLIGSITKGTNTSVTIEGSYSFIGIRARSSAMYLDSITVDWAVGDPTYTYSNAAIKFGGQITSTLWSRLNTESHGILGYGVMLATEDYLSGLTIKNYYDLARDEKADVDSVFTEVDGKDYTLVDGLSIKCFYNEVSTMPRLVNGNYVWDLVKGVNNNNAGLAKGYTAVAFVRTTDDEIIFLQETTKSAAQVAKDIINADPDDEYDNDYLDGSLGHLAGLAA